MRRESQERGERLGRRKEDKTVDWRGGRSTKDEGKQQQQGQRERAVETPDVDRSNTFGPTEQKETKRRKRSQQITNKTPFDLSSAALVWGEGEDEGRG